MYVFPFLFLSPADGIFGRCQQVPVIDIYKYEISPPVLQRLRIILEKLSHRGIVKTQDWELVALGGYNYFVLPLWGCLQKLSSAVCSRPGGADFMKVKSLLTHWICNEGLAKQFQERCFLLAQCVSVTDTLYTIKCWHPWMPVSYK